MNKAEVLKAYPHIPSDTPLSPHYCSASRRNHGFRSLPATRNGVGWPLPEGWDEER